MCVWVGGWGGGAGVGVWVGGWVWWGGGGIRVGEWMCVQVWGSVCVIPVA